jgi:hypothetical protein
MQSKAWFPRPSMRTSVLSFNERARQRLQRLAFHASLHASDQEIATVERLCDAVRLGEVTPHDAYKALTGLRRAQNERAA